MQWLRYLASPRCVPQHAYATAWRLDETRGIVHVSCGSTELLAFLHPCGGNGQQDTILVLSLLAHAHAPMVHTGNADLSKRQHRVSLTSPSAVKATHVTT